MQKTHAALADTPRDDHQHMWAQANGDVVLLSVHARHIDNLMAHWNTYGLHATLGCPRHAQWGLLKAFQDHRT